MAPFFFLFFAFRLARTPPADNIKMRMTTMINAKAGPLTLSRSSGLLVSWKGLVAMCVERGSVGAMLAVFFWLLVYVCRGMCGSMGEATAE